MLSAFKFILTFLFNRKRMGRLWVCNGYQEIEINTFFTPNDVYIDVGRVCGAHGCGSGRDSFDVKVVENGFIILCDIKSSRRKISWLAIE